MVTLSKERDGFVNVWEAEYTTAPPDWLAACQVYQALRDTALGLQNQVPTWSWAAKAG